MRHYTYDRRLNWSECDPGGIIFFPHYARWMVDGLNEMFLGFGDRPDRAEGRERLGRPARTRPFDEVRERTRAA